MIKKKYIRKLNKLGSFLKVLIMRAKCFKTECIIIVLLCIMIINAVANDFVYRYRIKLNCNYGLCPVNSLLI